MILSNRILTLSYTFFMAIISIRCSRYSSVTRRNICSKDHLRLCLTTLKLVTESNDLTEVKTKEQLEETCRQFQGSMKCVDDHLKRCFGQTERNIYNHVVAAARNLISNLCIPGKAQDDFLKHSECYNNISSKSEQCSEIYSKVIFQTEKVDDVEDVEKGLKKTCCTFRSFVQCRIDTVVRNCGSETGKYIQSHLEEISDPLIHEHCSSFSYTLKDCLETRNLSKDTGVKNMSTMRLVSLIFLYRLLFR